MAHAIFPVPNEVFAYHVIPHLTFWHLLRLREVCKVWQTVISQHLIISFAVQTPTLHIVDLVSRVQSLDLRYVRGDVSLSTLSASVRENLEGVIITSPVGRELTELTNLRNLSVSGSARISNSALSTFTKLERLHLQTGSCSGAGVRSLSALRVLRIEGHTNVSSDAFSCLSSLTYLKAPNIQTDYVAQLPLLRKIDCSRSLTGLLSHLTQVDSLSFVLEMIHSRHELTQLTQLTDLSLSIVSDLHNTAIGALANLKHLRLTMFSAADVGVSAECVSNLTDLQSLRISSGSELQLQPAYVSNLNNLKSLTVTRLSSDSDTSAALRTLTNLTRLSTMRASAEFLSAIRPLVKLRELFLDSCNISDTDLLVFTRLERLQLQGIFGMRGNCLSRMPQLTSFSYLHSSGLTCKSLAQLTQLQKLTISANSRISDLAIRKLTNLTHLSVCDCSKITRAGVSALSHLQHLGSNIATEIPSLIGVLPELAPAGVV